MYRIFSAYEWDGGQAGLVVAVAGYPNRLAAFIETQRHGSEGRARKLAELIAADPRKLDLKNPWKLLEDPPRDMDGACRSIVDLRECGLWLGGRVPGFIYGLSVVPLDVPDAKMQRLTPYCPWLASNMHRDLHRRLKTRNLTSSSFRR